MEKIFIISIFLVLNSALFAQRDVEQIIKMMEVKGAHAKIQPTLNYKTIEEFN